MKKTGLIYVAVTLLLVVLTYLYLLPGSQAMLEGRTDMVMSDGTDPAALPYIYDQILQVFHKTPSYLLYGSVYIAPPDPEHGFSYWTPWSERWIVVAASPFFPPEQLSTVVVFVLMMANGLSLFLLARYLGWNLWLAIGAAIAWAFNPFTRARAKVHMAMAGLYHLPLIFLALVLIARGRTWRSLVGAALCLVVACTTVHYFVVTSLFLTPFFLAFLALQPESRANWKRVSLRLLTAAVPAVLFLGFNFAFPVPPAAKITSKDSMPKSGETENGSLHPFLTRYAAHPIDFLAGDIALQMPPRDLNPLRQLVNESIENNLDTSNPHERSNGVRWSLLILAALAVVSIKKSSNKTQLGFFIAFTLFGLWLALPPSVPFGNIGPSGWLFSLVSQVRVPSRAGILVSFGILMLAGLWLNSRPKTWLLLPGVFPLLMLVDYPPLVQSMPMVPLAPPYAQLQRERGPCGPGMYFPFVNNYEIEVLHYIFLQQMRGSDCPILNGMGSIERLTKPALAFPPTGEFLSGLERNLVVTEQLVHLAACVPLDWIAFDSHVPAAWLERTCARLGWRLEPNRLCISPQRGRPLVRFPDQCL